MALPLTAPPSAATMRRWSPAYRRMWTQRGGFAGYQRRHPAPQPSATAPGAAQPTAPPPAGVTAATGSPNAGSLYDPTQVLSGTQIPQLAQSMLAPQIDFIRQAGAATQQQAAEYYKGVAKEADKAVKTQKALGKHFGKELKGIGKSEEKGFSKDMGSLLGDVKSDQAIRGNQPGDDSLAKAMLSGRKELGKTSSFGREFGAKQTYNFSGYQNALRSSAVLAGGELQGRLGYQTGQQVAQAASQYPTLVNQIMQNESDKYMAQQGLGLKDASLQQQGQYQQGQLDLGGQRIGATLQGQQLSHADRVAKLRQDRQKDAYLRAHHLGPYKLPAPRMGARRTTSGTRGAGGSGGGMTATARKQYNDINSATRQIAYARSVGWNDAKSRTVLAQKGYGPATISAAMQVLNMGSVGPATLAAIRRRRGMGGLPGTGYTRPSFPNRRPLPGTARRTPTGGRTFGSYL